MTGWADGVGEAAGGRGSGIYGTPQILYFMFLIPNHYFCAQAQNGVRAKNPGWNATERRQRSWALAGLGSQVRATKPPPSHQHCTHCPDSIQPLHCLRAHTPGLPLAETSDSNLRMHSLCCSGVLSVGGPINPHQIGRIAAHFQRCKHAAPKYGYKAYSPH